MIIAVDFDGTIVEHRFPAIGKELPFAIDTIKALQKMGHRIILWTYRTGVELENAVEFCRERGVHFYAVNRNYPEEEFTGGVSRKIYADVYIDDRNLGGLPEWMEVYRMLCSEAEWKKEKEIDSRKGLFKRLFDWN
ncbi:MAG: BT0820 family HAD-type phosphatase [Marinifilaceae bacterium]